MKSPQPDSEEPWVVEFTAEEAKQINALRDLGVNGALCGAIAIGRGTAGEFIATWEEEHPERGFFDEFYPRDHFGFAERTPERQREWTDLRERMPSKGFSEEITRREAFEIIASLSLPSEFHADAGL